MLNKIKELANKLSNDLKDHHLVKNISEKIKKHDLIKNITKSKEDLDKTENEVKNKDKKSKTSDIFKGIFDGENKEKLEIKSSKDEGFNKKHKGKKFSIEEYVREKHKDSDKSSYKILFHIYNYIWFIFSIAAALLIGAYFFFFINLDKGISQEYDFLLPLYKYTLKKHVSDKQAEVTKAKREIKNKIKIIKQYTGEIPEIIYIKSFNFQNLSENLKKGLKEFYDFKNGKIKRLNSKEKRNLEKFFTQAKKLDSLKIVFEDEHILHSIINKRIYWKDVYRDLKIVTDEVFNYNEILNYVVYNNLSISEQGEITISGKITSPHGNVFSGLIDLVKGINRYGSFNGAKVSTFTKTKNEDGSFSSFINLKLKYTK